MPTNGPLDWYPGLTLGATCTALRTESVPGSSGAGRGTEGPNIVEINRGRIYVFDLENQ